ncbi:MAG: cytochrome c [Candidatus Eremiobacteraeota bacterium]|nr:cytochrome c [Candidatus Eremiobacteraeota bacterium]
MKRTTAALTVAVAFCLGTAAFQFTRPANAAAESGKALYESRCASCHQPDGKGVPGTFPPLAGNKDETAANPSRVIGIVKHGLNTELVVNGKKYPGGMPAWKGQLTDAEIAAILTYIRSSWGNKASAVTEKQVAAVK